MRQWQRDRYRQRDQNVSQRHHDDREGHVARKRTGRQRTRLACRLISR